VSGNRLANGDGDTVILLARSNDEACTCVVRPHTLHGGGNSRSLPSTVTVMPGDVNSPYHKQFVHSKSQQYRRLKTEWRNNVYLRRSNVQVHTVCTVFISLLLLVSQLKSTNVVVILIKAGPFHRPVLIDYVRSRVIEDSE